jgi:hypothetical protein
MDVNAQHGYSILTREWPGGTHVVVKDQKFEMGGRSLVPIMSRFDVITHPLERLSVFPILASGVRTMVGYEFEGPHDSGVSERLQIPSLQLRGRMESLPRPVPAKGYWHAGPAWG